MILDTNNNGAEQALKDASSMIAHSKRILDVTRSMSANPEPHTTGENAPYQVAVCFN